MKKLFYSIVFLFTITTASAQHPFLQEVYDEIRFVPDIVYGENATVLYLNQFGECIKEPLLLDMYLPLNDDTCFARPLIIYFHSGNFLPPCLNQTTVGTRRDSTVVNFCKRLARSGYAVASADYRLGWNPLATPEINATAGIINAAYRGVQDANTAIRFFKKTFSEEGDPFRIDTGSIVLFGDDSGGYISLHAACLDDYNKILVTTDNQFLIPTGIPNPPFIPMIFEGLNGDVEGKQYGIMDTINYPFPLPYPHGDTLNYPNHIEYSSKFSVAVSMGSAVADTAWIDPGQPPMICAHVPFDQTTPYRNGFVRVAGQKIIKVYGSYLVTKTAEALGNNNFDPLPQKSMSEFQLAISDIADQRNDHIAGLLPVFGDTITDGTPWVFWDPETHPCSDLGFITNPHMTRAKAESYIDTILAFVLPRLFTVLDPTNICIVPTKDFDHSLAEIIVFPNPAAEEIYINSGREFPIQTIELLDNNGRLVSQQSDIGQNFYHFPVNHLVPGQYILRLQFANGYSSHQILIQ